MNTKTETVETPDLCKQLLKRYREGLEKVEEYTAPGTTKYYKELAEFYRERGTLTFTINDLQRERAVMEERLEEIEFVLSVFEERKKQPRITESCDSRTHSKHMWSSTSSKVAVLLKPLGLTPKEQKTLGIKLLRFGRALAEAGERAIREANEATLV